MRALKIDRVITGAGIDDHDLARLAVLEGDVAVARQAQIAFVHQGRGVQQRELAGAAQPAARQRVHAARQQVLRQRPLQSREHRVAAGRFRDCAHRCISSWYCRSWRKSRASARGSCGGEA